MRLIAIVGMTGSGKSQLSELFEDIGYVRIRFGDITDDLLKEQGKDLTEENERALREKLRKEHGMEAYAKLNLEKIQDALEDRNVIVDGLYSWEEYLFLKNKFGEKLIVLATYAPPESRYERLIDREVRSLTKEQARKRDKTEIENLNKGAPIAMADYTILNVGTLYDLKENFEKFMEWLHEKEEE
ncbi:AAA family ATPase [Candidatus Woesearchaeota archaeon]|nr:AAA family ATPase [Candidatus Woesearchaeota archaeon]